MGGAEVGTCHVRTHRGNRAELSAPTETGGAGQSQAVSDTSFLPSALVSAGAALQDLHLHLQLRFLPAPTLGSHLMRRALPICAR